MGDVIKFKRTTPATDHEKAQVFLRILKAAGKYIAYAQEKGVYKGWNYEGSTLVDLIDKMVLDHEE